MLISVSLAFLAGILVLVNVPVLPSTGWLLCLPVLLALATQRPLRLPVIVVCGFLWALWRADLILQQELPRSLELRELIVTGQIVSLPVAADYGTRFLFAVDTMHDRGKSWPAPGLIQLTWAGEVDRPLRAGDRWRLKIKLKRAHGVQNPAGFDQERQLFLQRIRAKGSVRVNAVENQRLAPAGVDGAIDRWRQRIGEQVTDRLRHSDYAGIVLALSNGDQHAITDEQWAVMRDTGTIHLMSISGLHVSLVAGMVFWLGRMGWRYTGLTRTHWPADRAAAVVALLVSVAYCALAGFAIPTQRALVMVTVALLAIFWRRATRPMAILAAALLVVIVYDPFAVLSMGFWLSYGAVAVLIYGVGNRVRERGVWAKWGRAHWVATVGLAPALLYLFHYTPLSSMLANLLAVPWTSFTTVPLALFGALMLPISTWLGEGLIQLASDSVAVFWPVLQWLQQLQLTINVPVQPPWWSLLLALLGVAWLLAPRGMPARWLGLLWCLPMLAAPVAQPRVGEAWFTLLDVGQGLAMVVRTRDHVLVYDAGPRFGQSYDAGEAVVLPYLSGQGVNKIDTLMISHSDMDHVGGADALLANVAVGQVLASQTHRLPAHRVTLCRRGLGWAWDGVNFDVLSPLADEVADLKDNDQSCVLRITAGEHVVLLTGDIEAYAEERLLANYQPAQLRAQVLLVPHHGSNSSSTMSFIDAVAPRYALFATGYRNHFRFPREAVQQRYRSAGVIQYDTARLGAIDFRLDRHAGVSVPVGYRQVYRRFWHNPLSRDSD